MMESANLWKGDDLACFGALNRPRDGTVLTQGQVSARAVVVVKVGCKNAPKVPLVDDDQVVEAFPPYRADHPFNERVLPGRSGCCHNFLDPHGLDPGANQGTVNAVPIADHIARRAIPWECFRDLLCHPCRSWMCRHAEVDDLPAFMVQNDEDYEKPERGGRQDEEIDRRENLCMVAQKCPPRL